MNHFHTKSSGGFSNRSCYVGGHTHRVSSVHLGSYHKKQHGESHFLHHGKPHPRAPSVHGGSGGKGISISKHSSFNYGDYNHGSHLNNSGSHRTWNKHGSFSVNEKETMQFLNDRLESYMEKVHSLENENTQLELNIREWYSSNQPSGLPDFSHYFRTIQELQGQIAAFTVENARIVLQISNVQLASDDFRNKYEMELRLGNSVAADMNSLRKVLEGLNQEICSLDAQVRNLQEELQQMKRNHEEEVNILRAQLGQRVNVEVDVAPSVDLNRSLSEIRQQYEDLMERNLREVENMFFQRSEELNLQVTSGSEQLQSVQTDVIDLRRNVQALEIELQGQLSMKSALEGTLAETEAGYTSQLAQLQGLINNVESQLAQIRSDLERQNQEYKILMDQKTHLEIEISTYKRLLDGHDFNISDHLSLDGKNGHSKNISYRTEVFHQIKSIPNVNLLFHVDMRKEPKGSSTPALNR
ncbi:keratin, type I cytoskeletal 19-like [Pelodytes ibericus]